jgi:hypothetical protein
MVNPLINDGSLIGFWPLQEPSGAATFHNYSPHLANRPSGISFNLKIHTCLPDATGDEERSIWPGTTTNVVLGTSGVPHTNAYKAQGNHLLAAGAGEHHKVLIMGDGGQWSRGQLFTPRVAQSGFTAGFWVNPQSNGRLDRNNPRNHAKAHALMGIAEATVGWYIGVSGALQEAAQNELTHTPFAQTAWGQPNEPSGLAAFVMNINGSNSTTTAGNANYRNTPIESGRFTHITVTYRFISDDGATNTQQIVLYKDGRVAASGSFTGVTDANAPVAGSAAYNIRTLCIGGSTEETDNVDRYKHATGWGHLMSGVYYFKRVLHEGEILDLHGAGGLQPFEGVGPLDSQEVTTEDSKLIGHYPSLGPGFPDVSRNRWPLLNDLDQGDETRLVTTPGPFKRWGVHAFGAAEAIGLGCVSGMMQSIVDNQSFTVAGWFSPEDDAHDFDQNMLFSLGQTTTSLVGVPTEASMGFYANTDSTDVRYLVRFFQLGIHNAAVSELRGADINLFSETAAHISVVYDNQTQGVALYVDGALQQSGTLTHSFSDQVTRLVGSGFPLVFLNGVSSSMSSSPYLSAGGADNASSEFVVFGRPLLPAEIRFLANSGINIDKFQRTVHDPRLFGYWPCNTLDAQALIMPDMARVWDMTPANLVRGTNDDTWNAIQATDNQGPWYRRDEFSRRYGVPAALDSQLPLGITSGAWCISGGSQGVDFIEAATEVRRSSLASWSQRFRPFTDSRTDNAVTPFGYILGFELTPSGNIRSIAPGALFNATPTAGIRHNTLVHYFGIDTSTVNTAVYSYVTRNAHTVGQPAGSSGVSIVFEGRDTAANTVVQIASGNVPFGTPSKILLHAYFPTANYYADAANSPFNISLYINGINVYTRRTTATLSRLWSTSESDQATQYVLNFGGIIAGDNTTPAGHIGDGEVGLGEMYLRNMFVMKGFFSGDDLTYFATSGILNDPVLTGYTNQQATTQVTINHDNLQGYYRFSGSTPGSGERDLSLKNNNLVPLARIFETNNPPLFDSRDNPAHNLRFVPGPLLLSDLGVQASGITYESNAFASTVVAPPYVASGEVFQRPDFGFAIGFWLAKRETIAGATSYKSIVSFGNVPDDNTQNVNVIDLNHSWAIQWTPANNIAMYISQSGTGSMYLDPDTTNAAQSGTIVCGAYIDTNTITRGTNFLSNYRSGFMFPGHIDSWNHYLWSYDAAARVATCYMNGTQVDQKVVSSGVGLPLDAAARLISLLIPQTGAWAWNATVNRADIDCVLTDVCYFSAPITAAEARYIAFNGIDSANGTATSGTIGGFVHGQDTGSGLIGGWFRGHDSASGLIGGYSPGGTLGSGEPIGGFVSGIVFAEGTLGGFVRGLDTGSGIIAGFMIGADLGSGRVGGYIRALDTGSGLAGGFVMGGSLGSGYFGGYIPGSEHGSGLIGGFITGGLRGFFSFDSSYTVEVLAAKDFDSQLEIAKTTSADFDAKLIIFQDESPPLVAIEIPGSTVTGLMPPFNQYFIGRASGLQGKTITQTRWNFGDFTPPVAGSLSGTSHYPVLHRFAASGFYIVRFEAIDSNGLHASDTRIINAASGIDPVIITLSGVPRSGNAALIVDFDTNVDILPPGVSVITQLLNFDDGQTTTAFNPTHAYTEPGIYKPTWMIRDSRGITWSDGLKMGSDILTGSED